MARRVALIGSNAGVAQAALTLAEMGAEVALIMPSATLGFDTAADMDHPTSPEDMLLYWPLLLRAAWPAPAACRRLAPG